MVEVCLKLGYYAQAIEYIERSKARNLVEFLVTSDLYPKGNIPETVLYELKYLQREITAEQQRLDIAQNLQIKTLSDSTHLDKLKQQLDELITRRIQPIDPNFSRIQKVEPIPFNEIQALLDEQTALIEWYITSDTFITFIVTSRQFTPLVWQSSLEDRQALGNWANEYVKEYLENKIHWQKELATRLHLLAKILHIDDILSQLPTICDQLILVPHRFLHLFPLHALPVENNRQKIQDKNHNSEASPTPQLLTSNTQHCLIDRFSQGVRYAPSCQLLQLSQNRRRPNFNRLFAVQNPTSDLTYADLEVTAIRRYFQVTDVLVGAAAKKDAIHNEQIQNANCVHFSCHSSFNFQSPLLSAFLLAGEPLTLGEIVNFDLNQCRLVTLSASETVLTDFTSVSDEYIGFPSAFLYAGSLSVVGSLWAPSDLSTTFLMIKFYENLKHQIPVAVALNQAQLWLRDVTKAGLEQWIQEKQLPLGPTMRLRLFRGMQPEDKPFQALFHWAAFCVIGQ